MTNDERRLAEARAQHAMIGEMLDGVGAYSDKPLPWRLAKAHAQSAVLRAVLATMNEKGSGA